MGSRNRVESSAKPEFGEPTKRTPREGIRPGAQSPYWHLVVEHAKKNEGMWIPLLNPKVSVSRLRQIASEMQSETREQVRHAPFALQEKGMRARWTGEKFYFRYDKPIPEPHVVTGLPFPNPQFDIGNAV